MGINYRLDEQDKFRMHASNSIAVALGIERDQTVINDTKRNPGPFSLHSLMRAVVQRSGKDAISMNPAELYSMSISSSDLPAILENVINKSVQVGYNEARPTFEAFTHEDSANNFNQKKLVKMSNFGDIDDLPEGAPFKNKKLSDKYEPVQVDTKGNTCTVTRQAMINDDTGAISQTPRLMGQAVARRRNIDAYDLLTSNSLVGPTMNEDNTPLFHTNHKNMTTGALTITTLAAAEKLLLEMPVLKAEQSDSDQFMNLPAKYMIAGTGLKLTAQQLLNTAFDAGKNIPGVYNPFNDAIIPVFDPYLQSKLTAASRPNAYYLAADKDLLTTLTIVYLSGQKEPFVRMEYSRIGAPQGLTFEIFSDWCFGIADYRGLIYSAGQ